MTLIDCGIITALKPIGGWRYPQLLHKAIVVVKPDSAPKGNYRTAGDQLVAAVRLFREQHGIPPGEPESDIAAFIRSASPQNDYYHGKMPDTIGKIRVRAVTPLIEELRTWIDLTARQKPELINPADAVERGSVCMTCPHNVKWKINCAPCVKSIEDGGMIVRQAAFFELDDALRACRLHKLYLPAAVFIDRDGLPQRSEKAPENCWLPK